MKSFRRILEDYQAPPGAALGDAEGRCFDRSKFDAELNGFLDEVEKKIGFIVFALIILVIFAVLIIAILVWDEKILRRFQISKTLVKSVLALCIPVVGWTVRQFMNLSRQRGHVRLIRIFARHASGQQIQQMIAETLREIPKIL